MMTKRTSKESYRRRYLRLHGQYEKWASVQYRRFFKEMALNIRLTGPKGLWREQIEAQLPLEDFIKINTYVFQHIAYTHGKRIGRDVDAMSKAFDLNKFETDINNAIVRYVRNFGYRRVISIRRNFVEHILDLVANDDNLDLPIDQVTKIIRAVVGRRNFYRWQAERIARTEATGASSWGAIHAADTFGFVVNKQWLSAQDARTRRPPKSEYDHYHMDGVTVGQTEFFTFNGGKDRILFPGDPTGEPGNIINCRCTVAMIPAKDKNGRLIRK